jgi:hypothetical protein
MQSLIFDNLIFDGLEQALCRVRSYNRVPIKVTATYSRLAPVSDGPYNSTLVGPLSS